MATIKAIEGRTIHQIQSGQVIVDLCSVVKELVENSLDAGATSIDVRFKNQGLDAIEVQDNGEGISPHNYETLALKHHTSKLSTYSDLTTLQTFGFRGEALSSLCALSKFSVLTCMAKDAPRGTKLEFEVSGKLKDTSMVAAQKGTTVSVENLFNNLPVRRRELERNIKREWTKVTGVLSQYACIQTGIKFSVTQQAGKGKKTTLFSTKGNRSTRENIINVFGAKTLTALIALDLKLELDPTSAPSQRWSTQENGPKNDIHIVGHISRPASGEGRQSPDRQMFFVNSRPCGLPQVAKAFNEVYKTYNGSQSPFIFANIELDTHLYDVNVSPDKRTILLHDQNSMLENLKEALVLLFESQDYTVPISQLPAQKQPSYKQLTISRENSGNPRASQTSAASDREVDDAGFDDARSDDTRLSRREKSADDEGSPRIPKPFLETFKAPKLGAVSRASMIRDADGISLISKWAERRSKERPDEQAPEVETAPRIPVAPSEEKRRLVEKLRREDAQPPSTARSDVDLDSSFVTTHSTMSRSSVRSPPIPGFNGEELLETSLGALPGPDVSEESIPALESPEKPSSSIADRFSSTPKSYRSSIEVATITIGDESIMRSMGTPILAQARAQRVPSMLERRHPSVSTNVLPSFGKSLSQKFSAPGIQTVEPPASSEDEEETAMEDAEEEDNEQMQDAPLSPDLFVPRSPSSVAKVNEPSRSPSSVAEVNAPDVEVLGKNHIDETVMKEEEPVTDSLSISADIEDDECMDETKTKMREEEKVQAMIHEAEKTANLPSQENIVRTKSWIKGGSKKKDQTYNLTREINTSIPIIGQRYSALESTLSSYHALITAKAEDDENLDPEEKLSLTISKSDFATMKIIGQFNLGFILATRSSAPSDGEASTVTMADDMFIIDQHASDEKYNFERLQATTIVQSQRLVYPKTLDLTALEEEIVMENLQVLEKNGFGIKVDDSGQSPVGGRCSLVSLPLSRETAFNLSDLDELLTMLAEGAASVAGTVPRPSKVRKMFAMRACRSSVMIGKSLTSQQMGRLVRHLGDLDKPWNCPHGRPTMRHLCALGGWDGVGWREGDYLERDEHGEVTGISRVKTNWAAYLRKNRGPIIASASSSQREDVVIQDSTGEAMEDEGDDEVEAYHEAYAMSALLDADDQENEDEDDQSVR